MVGPEVQVLQRQRRSLLVPIVSAVVMVGLAIALMVGWILIIVQSPEFSDSTWLLVLGIVSFAWISASSVAFCVILMRSMLESRRHARFIDSVTHELRSPLTALKLCLETLDRAGLEPAQRLELRGMMARDVQRLKAFIEDILTANRLTSAERPRLSNRPVDVLAMIEGCAARMGRRHGVGSSVFELEISAELHIASDPTALETICNNLLDNAVKYSDPPLTVHVSAWMDGDTFALRVEDGGIGLSPSDIKRIFRRFYRADREAVRRRHGTGLGLYVAYGLTRDLGGKLSVASRGIGHGSTFELRVPICPSEVR